MPHYYNLMHLKMQLNINYALVFTHIHKEEM